MKLSTVLTEILSRKIDKDENTISDYIEYIFFLICSFSTIIFISWLITHQILSTVLIIIFWNRLYPRLSGFHASSLLLCYLLSCPLVIVSSVFIFYFNIPPLLTLVSCMLLEYDNLEQPIMLGVILLISFTLPEYSYLSDVLFVSVLIAWCSNGKSIGSKVLAYLDNLLGRE